ncbi:MAG: gamma-glutamyltransferase [Inquilinus sp.]|nr:gamma-glutamyltransferase [Inquilinus sp.]
MLRGGGNAVDAALAGLAAACIAEPMLASLGGGGFLLVRPVDGTPVLYDFFAQTPRQKRPAAETDFGAVLIDFGPATQEFHIGLGAAATPGTVKGLFAAHADHGRLPIAEVLAPAIALARDGVALSPMQGYVVNILRPIATGSAESARLFKSPGHATDLIAAGERLRWPALADMLEALAREGERLFYEGEIAAAIAATCHDAGGLLTREDLTGYRVVRRPPLGCDFAGARILTNPPPSAGGALIALALTLLEGAAETARTPDDPAAVAVLARAMGLANEARVDSGLADDPTAAAMRLGQPDVVAAYRAAMRAPARARRGTTHISVVDRNGNAASLSISNGEGCGLILPDAAGFMLNNMLGEEDVNPRGFHRWPTDTRLSSMMAPTVVLAADRSIIALGSGGSNRLRSAILQVLVNLLRYRLPIDRAVAQPRLHLEGDFLNVEAGLSAAALDAAVAEAEDHKVWPERNLFFGGVHAVRAPTEGAASAAGDPRRGGAAIIV